MTDNELRVHFDRVLNGSKVLNPRGYRYKVCREIIAWFKDVLQKGDKFIFDKPCDGGRSYDLYAIANYDGVIMAEYISNANRSNGIMKHELGTKGTESAAAMIEAIDKYLCHEGTVEHHPEWKKENIRIVLG